ncbi:hypothetical protein JOS77_29905 [Chromobacterium haemolyticum]|nr:hypothetical protein JOS77_29905 [Chromobacterium haemolyticum]
MQLHSRSFQDGERIPGRLAFCVPDAGSHVALSRQPQPASDLERGAGGDALVCVGLP